MKTVRVAAMMRIPYSLDWIFFRVVFAVDQQTNP
jgi:hypothetical protein